MAIQDWYGLERYIVLARQNWMDLHWSIGGGISLVALMAFNILIHRLTKE